MSYVLALFPFDKYISVCLIRSLMWMGAAFVIYSPVQGGDSQRCPQGRPQTPGRAGALLQGGEMKPLPGELRYGLTACCCKICTHHHSHLRTPSSPPTHSLLYRAPWTFSNETETLQISNQPTLDRQEKVLSNPRSVPEVNSLEGDVPLLSATFFVFVKDPISLVSPAIFCYNVINVLLTGPGKKKKKRYIKVHLKKRYIKTGPGRMELESCIWEYHGKNMAWGADSYNIKHTGPTKHPENSSSSRRQNRGGTTKAISKTCTFDPIKSSRKKNFLSCEELLINKNKLMKRKEA